MAEAFYMAVITFSTVGFGEILPLDQKGQIFTSFYIILNICIYAYAITSFSAFVIKGEIFKTMHMTWIEKKIKELKNHVIVSGYGKYGEEIVHHFMTHDIQFVIIERDPERVEIIQKSKDKILYVEGDATEDETLESANIVNAKAFVSALADDTDNVFSVLTARQLNPNIEIISRAVHQSSENKLRKAGANHVINPDLIGGFYIATLVTKPGAVEFFSFITNEFESDIGFEVLDYEDLPESCRHYTIKQLNIRKETGGNIIGKRKSNGQYVVNPGPDERLEKGANFIKNVVLPLFNG